MPIEWLNIVNLYLSLRPMPKIFGEALLVRYKLLHIERELARRSLLEHRFSNRSLVDNTGAKSPHPSREPIKK